MSHTDPHQALTAHDYSILFNLWTYIAPLTVQPKQWCPNAKKMPPHLKNKSIKRIKLCLEPAQIYNDVTY